MNEVEKMYETIFCEFAPNCSLCTKLIDCEIINNTHNCNKFECDYIRLFTAEKQLELIKWLAKRQDFGLEYYPNSKVWDAQTQFSWEFYCKTYKHEEFEQALAGLTNTLWQDLTEAEKAEIKNILE